MPLQSPNAPGADLVKPPVLLLPAGVRCPIRVPGATGRRASDASITSKSISFNSKVSRPAASDARNDSSALFQMMIEILRVVQEEAKRKGALWLCHEDADSVPRLLPYIHNANLFHTTLKRSHIAKMEVPPPPAQGCIRREGTSEAAPEAVGQAVGGGWQSGCGQ